ncbi:unnamed protein product [Prorocentrum cordatum]|uniref:Large ribosomal subunit protein eL20 domain-containing protein n=1 Tax=Prorocentrum cordatum TaxID=2364126 RepID=A0ABN9TAS9_9DINO|nr:unnamed protein product [Polarella glacialis]
MGKFAVDPSLAMKMHQYQIVGRAAPTPKNPTPKIYRMRMFAKNKVLAKSRFWYPAAWGPSPPLAMADFMKKLNKAKKSGGELLAVNELFDRGPTKVKNYGVWLRYESRTDTHNMYKEFRDITINGAISQLYQEMAGRHRAQAGSIQIIHATAIPASACRRDHVTEMHDSGLKYPVITKLPLVAKRLRTTFKASRPMTFVR